MFGLGMREMEREVRMVKWGLLELLLIPLTRRKKKERKKKKDKGKEKETKINRKKKTLKRHRPLWLFHS